MNDQTPTISSEENMIGEALMRVSNTLEAQRLTQSLDYQEKIRRRTNARFTIAIIMLVLLLVLLIVGAVIAWLLWRYADPVLEQLIPFMKKFTTDLGILWGNMVESSNYMPVMVRQLTEMMDEVIAMLRGVNGIDLGGMLQQMGMLLSTTNAMLLGLLDLMVGIGPMAQGALNMLGEMGQMFPPLLECIMEGAGELGKMFEPVIGGFGNLLQSLDFEPIGDLLNNLGQMMSDFSSVGANLAGSTNEFLSTITGALGNLNIEGMSGAIVSLMNTFGTLLSGFASAMEGLMNILSPILP